MEAVEKAEKEDLKDPETKKAQEDLKAELRRMQERVYHPVDWQELGKLTVDWWKLAKGGGKGALEIASAFFPGVSILKKAIDLAGDDKKAGKDFEDAASAIKRDAQKFHRDQLVFMEQFEGEFRQALKKTLGEDGRLIVFVDDLDRCLPEKAVEVIEAIKLFLEVKQTVFVLGMDVEVIVKGIEAYYKGLFQGQTFGQTGMPISGNDYLQKIVQIPFQLPPLIMVELDRFIMSLDEMSPEGTGLSEMTRKVFTAGLQPNPRQIKRTLNIFRLLKKIAEAREDAEGVQVAFPLLAKTVLIQTQWPELNREWRAAPHARADAGRGIYPATGQR